MAIPVGSTEATGNVLTNDTVTGGTPIVTSVAVQGGATGTVGSELQGNLGQLILQANGSYTYATGVGTSGYAALPAGQTATETFTYTPSVNGTAGAPQTLTITVTGVNDAPVPTPDSGGAAAPGAAATGNVLANDRDPDTGDTLTVIGVRAGSGASADDGQRAAAALPPTAGTYGTLVMNDDGSYSYTVDAADADFVALSAGQAATETFIYAVSDGTATRSATLSFTVTGVNDAPVGFVDDGGTATIGATLTGNVLTNDRDPDAGAVMHVSTAGTGTGKYGTVTINADGSYSYAVNAADPDTFALGAGQTGTESFYYEISDGTMSGSARLTFQVSGVNDAPVATADRLVTFPDTRREINLLSNDSDPDGGTLRLTSVTYSDGTVVTFQQSSLANMTTAFGGIQFHASGVATFLGQNTAAGIALPAGTSQTDRFSYTISDGALSSTASFDLVIEGRNDAPSTNADRIEIYERGKVITGNVLANDSDADTGSSLTLVSVVGSDGQPVPLGQSTELGFLRVTINADGSFTAKADTQTYYAQLFGAFAQPFRVFTYTVSDGTATATGDVLLNLIAFDDLPILRPDVLAVTAGSTRVSGNLTANDTEIDLSQQVRVAAWDKLESPYGTIFGWQPNGDFAYAANGAASAELKAGQTATDIFTYTANGPSDLPKPTSTLTVTITGVDDATVAGTATLAAATEGGAATAAQRLFINSSARLPTDAVYDPDDTLLLAQINGQTIGTGTPTASITGEYGALVVGTGSSGTINYVIDNADPDTIALTPGQIAREYYSYRVSHAAGGGNGPDVTGVIVQQVNGDLGTANPAAPSVHVVTTGADIPTITGNTGADQLIVRGKLSGATLDAGADTVIFHLDTGTLAGILEGGNGTDTLQLIDNVGATLTPTELDIGARLRDFEGIDLAGTGNTTLSIRVQDVLDANGIPDTLHVTGTAGDRVDIDIPAWTMGADQTVDGQLYRTYTSGGATLLIDPDILVI
jgi:VCBS repeat-containing protein